MDDLTAQICNLLQSERQSADKITHALARIGDGKMDVGIKRLADFFMKTGNIKGEKRGLAKGIGGTLGGITILSVLYYLIKYIKNRINEKKEYEAEGKVILKELEEALNNSNECMIEETSKKDKQDIYEQGGVMEHTKSDEVEVYSYFKCNGDIEVHVFEDGTEIFSAPDDYMAVSTEEGDDILCPNCHSGDSIHYHNGEFICVHCENSFTEQELIDYCGCGIDYVQI